MPDSPITEEQARKIEKFRAVAATLDEAAETAYLFAALSDEDADTKSGGEAAVLRERADDLRHQASEVGKLGGFYRDIADYVEGPPVRK